MPVTMTLILTENEKANEPVATDLSKIQHVPHGALSVWTSERDCFTIHGTNEQLKQFVDVLSVAYQDLLEVQRVQNKDS